MTPKLSDPLLHFRTINDNDEEMLCQIYSSTRSEEMALLIHWTSGQKEAFLRSQFMAQHNYYKQNYEGAHFWVIEYDVEIIGRLYLHTHYDGSGMRIIDISLLPKWRNRGIGKQVLLAVMEMAENMNRPITIHVESFNPAMKLYKNLGFELVSQTNGIYHLLEWKPKPQAFRVNIAFNQSVNNGNRTTTSNSL